jgi:hypothetical protein
MLPVLAQSISYIECSKELAASDPEALGICIRRSGEDVLDEV